MHVTGRKQPYIVSDEFSSQEMLLNIIVHPNLEHIHRRVVILKAIR